MKKLSRALTCLLLLTLAVGLLSAGTFAGDGEAAQAVPVTSAYTRADALMSGFTPLTEGQYTEVPIDDPAPGNNLVGICSFTPQTDGYYRIQYTSATSSATVAMVDSDDTVSNALREDYSVKEWTIYGVYYLTADSVNPWLFEINAPYDSMKVLITKEDVEWTTDLPEELPVALYESSNLYTGFRLPSQKKPGSYYSVTERNFPSNVAGEKMELVSGGEYIELELVERTNSAGAVTSSYYKITGIAPGTAVLRLTTTYCGQTKTSDIQVHVTDLIVKAVNLTDEMEMVQNETIIPELVVYHRDGTISSYRDIETDAVLTYTYLSEGSFQYEGQTVKALSVDEKGCYTAEYPGFGIMMIEARKDGKLIAELGYNIIVTPAPDCAANGHSYDDGVVTRQAKYLTPGSMTFTCGVCGHEDIREIPTLAVPFTDVKTTAFYYTPMLWALDGGITKGVTDTTFVPGGTCTRAEAVTFLWRAAGSPAPKTTDNPFTDVSSNRYYYKAVLWAVENGITEGTTKTTFAPDEECTRGQVVTFLWRAAGKPDYSGTKHSFTDVKSNAFYYQAMLWAVEAGITKGTSTTTFEPQGACTRGQVVTFLYRGMNIPPVY